MAQGGSKVIDLGDPNLQKRPEVPAIPRDALSGPAPKLPQSPRRRRDGQLDGQPRLTVIPAPCPSLCPEPFWGRVPDKRKEAQSFRTGEVAVSPESSLSGCQAHQRFIPAPSRGLACRELHLLIFTFGLLGPIKEGEDSGGENHLEPREQPGRPWPAQTDLGFQGRPANPPPRKGTAALRHKMLS